MMLSLLAWCGLCLLAGDETADEKSEGAKVFGLELEGDFQEVVAQSLAGDPDVAVAEQKVRLAEVELEQVRALAVARRIEDYGQLRFARESLAAAEQHRIQAREQFERILLLQKQGQTSTASVIEAQINVSTANQKAAEVAARIWTIEQRLKMMKSVAPKLSINLNVTSPKTLVYPLQDNENHEKIMGTIRSAQSDEKDTIEYFEPNRSLVVSGSPEFHEFISSLFRYIRQPTSQADLGNEK
jgi:hypothetical protein